MMETFFVVLLVIVSVLIIVATLAMEPKTQGAGSAYGQETNVFGKSAHQSRDRMLQKITIICSLVFMISLIAILAIR
uniref:preprotein translocase subunit SecG n=1 Tax=Ndongobacter massiliensis TaxID=1871025 RepID=UPI0009F809DF|nr:preprotein translocase subunit SecG [Ndongobacter massiliensis]